MDYGDSIQNVLLRKICKAEQDLLQLKLDYCRFVYGLSHRTQVQSDGKVYLVRSVDVDTMKYTEDGGLSRPAITGTLAGNQGDSKTVRLGTDWELGSLAGPLAR